MGRGPAPPREISWGPFLIWAERPAANHAGKARKSALRELFWILAEVITIFWVAGIGCLLAYNFEKSAAESWGAEVGFGAKVGVAVVTGALVLAMVGRIRPRHTKKKV